MVYWLEAALSTAHPQEHATLAFQAQARAHTDAEILANLHEEYYDRVARYIAARTGNLDLAQDMAGEVFVRAVESFASLQARGAPPQAWLFRVAHNLVVDYYRKSGRHQSVPLEDVSPLAGAADPESEVVQRLTMERVRQAMERLHPSQREVINLRFMGELSSEEVAAAMGRTNGAVRELQRTALMALRKALAEMEGEAGPGARERGHA